MSLKPAAVRLAAVASALMILSPADAAAEEGLWTFDAFPAATVERDLGVHVGAEWLGHLLAGSVRLTTGCSGALVSPRGLVMTNEHCVLACAQSLSDDAHDHVAGGYGVGAADEEKPCPGLQAEILVGIADITDSVFKASAGKRGDDFVKARETILARAERVACRGDHRYRCQVIGFFGGGQFKVYKYRRYEDVRLVFAPEFGVAFFGGDPENFTFPRYDLDVAALRLYDRGRPAKPPAWLAWSARPPMTGEAVFVSGSPGTTQRALTMAQLETLRDVTNPAVQAFNARLRDRLIAFSAEGPHQRRLAADRLFDAENTLKVIRGQRVALGDPAFLTARRSEEAALQAAVARDPTLSAAVGDPWRDLAALRAPYARQFPLWRQLEGGAGAGSRLFWYARTLVRGTAERARPTAERLPEFSDARLPLIEKVLLDPQPVDARLEALLLGTWLEDTRSVLGADDPAAAVFLDQAEPAVLAHSLADGSRLADPAVRAALWKGGMKAVLASDDPLIAYVLKTDPLSRACRQVWENDVLGPTDAAAERIARVRFAVRGEDVYPDATFSPRISYGRVDGWRVGTAAVEPFTTLGGLYGHATDAEPRRLPSRWLAAQPSLDPGVVLNFVTTNDIVGGNSGSPVVDRAGAMVGAAFDGNQASLAGDFAYDGAANRTVVVSTAAIGEALAKVYGRPDLVKELDGR
ncbi:MAG: peptidase [Caulobacteraceae bacterium]|nr:peptidase [Caulobacteraceae bacterium]